MRRFAFGLLASVMAISTLAASLAEAATCFTLQAELNHLQSQGAGSDRSRYERAFREQANVIARTESRARSAGCFGGGFLLFRQRPNRTCRTLVPKLRDMQNNLARLDQLRRRGGGEANARRMRQIQAAIVSRGCGIPGRDGWDEARDSGRSEADAPYARGGTFRTLCVRTCDGYYFPISFSTSPEQFGGDAQTCSAMCPGADARLFYHPNPGGGPENMISLDESHYSDLPAAFQYRTRLDPSCTCKPAGGYSAISTNPVGYVSFDEQEKPASLQAALIPRPRQEPGADPETLANRAGGFVPGPLAGEGTATATGLAPDGRSVRIVGPAYWAAPEQEGVVLSPVPN